MSVRIRHRVCMVAIRALACGVALGVAGCASQPSKIPEAERLAHAIATPASIILGNYVDPVEPPLLFKACLHRMSVATGIRAEVTEQLSLPEYYRSIATLISQVPAEKRDAAVELCIRGMGASLDAQSHFLDAEDFNILKAGRSTGGIGLQLAAAPDGAKIVGALVGGPAWSANITSGDLLTAIDDVDLKGHSLGDITRLMRGAPGSSVTLTVQRAGDPASLRLTLVRQIIQVKPFEGRILERGYVYLQTRQLTERVPNELAETISLLRNENGAPLRGIILDLRPCPGGLLRGAIALSAAFLPPGALVASTKGKASDSNRRYSADPRDYWLSSAADPLVDLPELRSTPIVVLIGSGTASGCEVVAAALQDHKRAIVAGERSFGNGSVQTIIPLPSQSTVMQTALKLTTARLYRPSGELLDGKGVEADIRDPASTRPGEANSISTATGKALKGPNDDPLVVRALEILKSDSPLQH